MSSLPVQCPLEIQIGCIQCRNDTWHGRRETIIYGCNYGKLMLLETEAATSTEVCRNVKLADDGLEVCRRAWDDGLGFWVYPHSSHSFINPYTALHRPPRIAEAAKSLLRLILPHFLHYWTATHSLPSQLLGSACGAMAVAAAQTVIHFGTSLDRVCI